MSLISYFHRINKAFFRYFSVNLLLRTFFQPIKNEYRKGLIGFSIMMGIIVKSGVIIASFILFIPILILEALVLVGFLVFPLGTLALFIW